jgi:hypothetical protein
MRLSDRLALGYVPLRYCSGKLSCFTSLKAASRFAKPNLDFALDAERLGYVTLHVANFGELPTSTSVSG